MFRLSPAFLYAHFQSSVRLYITVLFIGLSHNIANEILIEFRRHLAYGLFFLHSKRNNSVENYCLIINAIE